MKINVVMTVFESGDYVVLGSSRHNDAQCWDAITENAPPSAGQPVMTYFEELPFSDEYLKNLPGW